MKKLSILIFVLTVTLAAVFGLSSCGNYGGKLTSEALDVNGTNISGKVSNATDTFLFIDDITVPNGSTWVLSKDAEGTQSIAVKVAELSIGNNVFYIHVTDSNNTVTCYTVNIYRNPIYTVSFNAQDGTSVSPQQVEEGGFAFEPSVPINKIGYTFVWNHDFSSPIVGDITIDGKCEAAPEMANFEFTSTSDACEITGIKDNTVAEIVIPYYVTSIERCAFYNCTALISVTGGDSVMSIGEYAFYNCTSLTNIVIGNRVTVIGDRAFFNCSSLTCVTIGANVKGIGESAFYNCCKLVEVINLSELQITAGKEFFGYVGFYAKEVHSGESRIVNKDGFLFYTYNGTNYLLGYRGSEPILVLPNDYNGENYEIYPYAFYQRTEIVSVTLPEGVTKIGDDAFRYCYKLVEVINRSELKILYGSSSHGYVGEYAIDIHKGESKIVDKDGFLFYAYDETKYLLGYNGTETEITLPNDYNGSSYSLYTNAFSGCKRLTSITLSDGVLSIGVDAFRSCTSLTSLTIGNNVESIGNYAFYDCSALSSVIIPDSVTGIGKQAFDNCIELTSVTIGSGVKRIGGDAFLNCIELENVCFKTTAGWSAGGVSISSADLADAEIAAVYLTETHRNRTWTR